MSAFRFVATMVCSDGRNERDDDARVLRQGVRAPVEAEVSAILV